MGCVGATVPMRQWRIIIQGGKSMVIEGVTSMSLVRWDNKYLVGHDTIDSDHKNLFQLINNFYDAFQETKSRRELAALLTKLVQYAEAHFRREEAIMKGSGYMLLGEHQMSHVKLYETIYALNDRLMSDPAPLDRAAVAFLKNWLTDHVMEEDLKVGEFLREQKAASTGTDAV
jgi:hemerythrin